MPTKRRALEMSISLVESRLKEASSNLLSSMVSGVSSKRLSR